MAKVTSVVGGCSTKNKPVGFQFVSNGGNYFLEGSFVMGQGASSEESALTGDFRVGQSYHTRGCRLCGNKLVYQCGHCGSFVCYDGKSKKNAECPVCHKKSNVPATTDERIVRSAVNKNIQIVMAMDVSGSMYTGLAETKIAAINEFVKKFPDAEIALVTFETEVSTVCSFTKDHLKLERAINSLRPLGGTSSPFRHIIDHYPAFCSKQGDDNRYLVVLTDGAWAGNADGHVNTAAKLKQNGVKIITIGCAGADMRFLAQVATPGANIEVSGNDIGGAYATAAKKISQ